MKELVHKIRQILMSTRVIENRYKYQILCYGCAGIHFLFLALMLVGKVDVMAFVNFLVTIFYILLGLILAPKEAYKILFVVAFAEVEINAVISSILLGGEFEFMIYTLPLIPGAFYLAHTWPVESKNKYGISLIPSISTFIVGIMYVIVDIVNHNVPVLFDGDAVGKIRPVFHYFNILIAIFLLLAFSLLFALEVRYIQKLLNDENSRLGEIATRDPLTKAFNRRALYNIINAEIAGEEHLFFGLIILDIDDFKKVNDTYGHITGDQVLVSVAKVIRENLREEDYFCRWGGEEFLLMIHGNDAEFEIVADRIRVSIEKQVFQAEEQEFSVTATLGISQYQNGLQIRTLIDMADQKLYYGKTHGKNQVVK